ncbi:hypothetical protein ASPFODRAFT_40140, partial [Aspergillus luchuensis CBS 106.47]
MKKEEEEKRMLGIDSREGFYGFFGEGRKKEEERMEEEEEETAKNENRPEKVFLSDC